MNKRRIRFNLLDVLIVIALCALVAGIIWRQELTDRVEQEEKENTVTLLCGFECSDGDAYIIGSLPEGDTTLYYNGTAVGVLSRGISESELSAEDSGDKGGESSTDTSKVSSFIRGTEVRLYAVEKDSGYYPVPDTKLLLGKSYRFNTKDCEFTLTITSIDEE